MVQCQNCGQVNNNGSNFCRFCGTRIIAGQQNQMPPQSPPPQSFQQQNQSYEYNPPRPYSWKTDEFQSPQIEAKAKKTHEINRVQPLSNFNPPQNHQQPPQPLVYQQHQPMMAHGYRCPHCGTQNLPIITRKISTPGWIVFAVLLFFTLIFFWIGLLMKEDVRICPVCGLRVG
jgi:RNA polymerase subunit RPABC4/transcription elongation factor Spt4